MKQTDTGKSLFIIWSSADPEVAHNAALMYAHNSLKRGWWERVRFIIWGPSAKLTATDPDIQAKLLEMKADGVEILACRACADNYALAEKLEAQGIDVVYVGSIVTEMLQAGWTQLTF